MGWRDDNGQWRPRNAYETAMRDKYGLREGVQGLEPKELGLLCNTCYGQVEWSEFKAHVWCPVCRQDRKTADSVVTTPFWMEAKELKRHAERVRAGDFS